MQVCIRRSTARAAVVLLSLAAATLAQPTVNVGTKTMENSLIKVRYGSPPSGYWGNGIVEFSYKPDGQNYGYTLDCFGCAASTYDFTGPSTYQLISQTSDMAEVEVRFTDCVNVTKRERIYHDLPVLEIQYTSISTMWYEDFLDVPENSATMGFYGVSREVNSMFFHQYADPCDWSNQGSCFIGNAGSSTSAATYNGHFIHGTHGVTTGRGIGEVWSTGSISYDSWKPWWDDRKVYNYETFNMSPTTRYVFIYDLGREGLYNLGRQIADWDNGGPRPLSQVPQVSITAPADSAQVEAGADVTVTGSATDPNGTVSKVELYSGGSKFYNNATKVGEVASSSFSIEMNGVTPGAHHVYAKATDNEGNVGYSPVVTVLVPRDPDDPGTLTAGTLLYEYYEGTWGTLPNFDALTPVTSGVTNGFNAIALRERDTNFGFRFSGYLNIEEEGLYTFYLRSDDGSKLYIGDTEVIENDGLHTAEEVSGIIALRVGLHPIRVEYFQRDLYVTLNVGYAGPSFTKRSIAASSLYYEPASGPAALLDLGRGGRSAVRVGTDHGAIRVDVATPGRHTVEMVALDGARRLESEGEGRQSHRFDAAALAQGIYVVSVREGGRRIAAGTVAVDGGR